MKSRLFLLSLLCIPIAALRVWDLIHYIDWETGFFNADRVYLFFSALVFLSVFLLLIPWIKKICRRRGLAAFEPEYGIFTRIMLVLAAASVGAVLFFRIKGGFPEGGVKLGLFILTCLFQLLCVVCLLLVALMPKHFPPLASAVTGLFPPMYFALDLLDRFFSGISNPYDTTTVYSFIAPILLTLTAVRWLQYNSVISERRQRSFIAMAEVCLIFCLGIRLPTIMIYLSPLNIVKLLPVACDTLCALCFFFCALDTAGKEY